MPSANLLKAKIGDIRLAGRRTKGAVTHFRDFYSLLISFELEKISSLGEAFIFFLRIQRTILFTYHPQNPLFSVVSLSQF